MQNAYRGIIPTAQKNTFIKNHMILNNAEMSNKRCIA